MSQQTEAAREGAQEQAEAVAAPEREARVARLFALVEAQFGERLDEAGRARVRELLGRQVDGAAQLTAAAATLDNGDEPDFTFEPYREA